MRDTSDPSDASGPSKNQLRSLTFQANQPAFLRNALSALQGPKPASERPDFDEHGRPAIPLRPEGEGEGEEEERGEESEEDEWDMGRGEEAPAVVVLKEGRHLGRDEVDRLRAEAKASSSVDPLASSSAPAPKSKLAGTLNISTEPSSDSKLKLVEGESTAKETWEDVVRRSKLEAEAKKVAKVALEEEEKRKKEATEKAKAKEKKKRSKAVAKLSFAEED